MCERSKGHPLSWPQLHHAICRNFGGLESEEIKPLEEFRKAIGYVEDSQDLTGLDGEVLNVTFPVFIFGLSTFAFLQMLSILNPDCSRLGLIKTSLNTKDITWHG